MPYACQSADMKEGILVWWRNEYLRGVASNPVDIGAELGVLDAVYFYHIYRGLIHAVVFVCQFIPCRL